ncbi:heparan-alpha-glucosaminide N-acetyltransferase domain-containing protein [Aquimarina pacifica]|uniref:heparan-alpha-glucosaminide N-acetyltransferase domain-containing protein n=1 Tax=Aquimarina pacifica TaxID=1296415 RepID=UPI00046F1DD7|nr:heparan-alpha-glucosaminide N-acetyltransferase domain-containing protein [Aquimarina pacifica]
MVKTKNRLHFLDALRAFAILMMLQGHFVHALLAKEYHGSDHIIYTLWEYCRGVTAPVFFTITGFIFIFLLVKQQDVGFKNPRVSIGIRRALKVILWGYLLRLSMFSIFNGTLNPSFFYIDVLQCIGLSLLLLIGIYLMYYRLGVNWFQYTLLVIGIVVFFLEPIYDNQPLEFLIQPISNYFTKANGSIFTIFPWFGYACFGGFLAIAFTKYEADKRVYSIGVLLLLVFGLVLIFYSSPFFEFMHQVTRLQVFRSVGSNNYLFMRLGDVFIVFSVFILIRKYIVNKTISKIGSKTLSVYIIHFFVLYGSWFGLGLTAIFYHALTPIQSFIGALLFVFGICTLVLNYYKYEEELKLRLQRLFVSINKRIDRILPDYVISARKTVMRRYRKLLYIRK